VVAAVHERACDLVLCRRYARGIMPPGLALTSPPKAGIASTYIQGRSVHDFPAVLAININALLPS
jgi:hypothetical protein